VRTKAIQDLAQLPDATLFAEVEQGAGQCMSNANRIRDDWLSLRKLARAIAAAVLGLLLRGVCAGPAMAQQASPPAQPVTDAVTLQELAETKLNPLADSFKLSFEFATAFGVGPNGGTGENLNIQPVIPFSLGSDWNVITRSIMSVTYVPGPPEEFGLGDFQASLFLTPAKAEKWIWGVGPIFQFPTATSNGLGTGKWSAGPTGALIYSDGPWFNGILVGQLWSFAGDRKRDEVNQTSVELLISYNFDNGWYLQSDPVLTRYGSADSLYAWTIPVGMDVGKVFKIGSQAMSVQVGAYDYVDRPQDAAHWIIRAQITFLFPNGK
jgi:hypothetical protein